MSEPKKLKLSIPLPPEAEATDGDVSLGEPYSIQDSIVDNELQDSVAQQDFEPINNVSVKRKSKQPKSNTSVENVCNEDQASSMASTTQETDCPANVVEEMMIQEECNIAVEPMEDAQDILEQKNNSVYNMEVQVMQYQPQAVQDQPQMSTSQILLENVQEKIDRCMLVLLVENVSGLSEEDQEFSIEMIPEKDAAVITLIKSTETGKFIEAFNQHHRVQQLNISACSMEVTKSILVENLPSGISRDYIALYFESKKCGGGPVFDVTYLPEENSAIVTFQDGKDVITVLAQNHAFNQVPLVVSPYYIPLGVALYGRQRPEIKMPSPFKVSLDPYYWKFLQENAQLLLKICNEMANYSCEVEWPTRYCPHPEVKISPSHGLQKKKRSLIRTWKEDVSTKFTQILSKWKVVKCDVNAEVWEAIKNSIVKNDILILPDIPKGIVVLVGEADATDHAAQDMKRLIENTAKRIEREKQIMEENVLVSSRKYTILNKAGLQDTVSSMCPDLKMDYNTMNELITLRGIATEVFKIKSIILEKLTSMVQKPVDVHPYIHLFLDHVNDETLSQLLFSSQKINALYAVMQEGVLLTAIAHCDLLKAEEVIKKDLTYACIVLDNKSVLKMKDWRELVDNVYEVCNETIIINEKEDQVIISGYFEEVASAHQKLSDFIDNNTYIRKTIKTESAAVTMYVEKEKLSSWLHLLQQGVEIDFGTKKRGKVISLTGSKKGVLKGIELFQNILSSLCATSVIIDKPGAKAFFREQEHLYVAGVMQQFNCLIRLQNATDKNGEEDSEDEDVPEELGPPRCKVKLNGGIVVTVHEGDLTRCHVDVVVNAANEDLRHIGGLADALLRAAGEQLQRECDDLVSKHGRVKPGCAIITGAWKLPCKQVIHAVGPRWNCDEKEKCTMLLKKAVKECLRVAETYNHQSIAIPAISSGFFGFPLKECTHTIVTSIKEAVAEYEEAGSLKQIYLVDSREETVQALSEALNEMFIKTESSSSPPAENNSSMSESTKNEITTPEGLKIQLQLKNLEECTTDAIVNSISTELLLHRSKLSRALLGKAGLELQEELNEQAEGKEIKEGCVLQTHGYALDCSCVLHAVLLGREQSQTSQKKILAETIEKCLKMSEEQHLNSITFPALRTAGVKSYKPFVAKMMFDEVFKFSQTNPKSLREVHFVLHPSNIVTTKIFTNELKKRLHASSSVLPETFQPVFVEGISTATGGAHKMQMGPVELLVESGDITKEVTDAIVNITNETFDLKEGVSRSIVERAGPWVELECSKLASKHRTIMCTGPGNLKCKNIIHICYSNDIKGQISKVLCECEQRHITSVAFPAIGTGKANRDPVEVADDMVDAILQFAFRTPTPVVKNIKIVVFQPHLQAVFYASMRKKESAVPEVPSSSADFPKSFFSKIADFFTFRKPAEELKPTVELKTELLLESTVEPAIFQICGDSQKNVDKTVTWVKTLILKNQDEIAITDEWISAFGKSEYEKLRELQQKRYVVIKIGSAGSLRILGVTKDVLSASLEIQEMLRKIRNSHEEHAKADLFSSIVEWRYEENGKYKPFNKLDNMQIEFAVQQQKVLDLIIENKQYKVDPNKLRATDERGRNIALRRISKTEENLVIPDEWEDMGHQLVKVVDLRPSTAEYHMVKQKFQQSCKFYKIEKIQRIQNPYKWQAYQIKKQEMDAKTGNNNEMYLFHGTASKTLDLINTSGFNRSYAGLHAAMYGNGTYFAVDARYSAHESYSKPDSFGRQHMYLARVLVGEYCNGEAGLLTPKAKNKSDPTNLYDSVTDNVRAPSIFVIFNDIQAYPQYLITFKK